MQGLDRCCVAFSGRLFADAEEAREHRRQHAEKTGPRRRVRSPDWRWNGTRLRHGEVRTEVLRASGLLIVARCRLWFGRIGEGFAPPHPVLASTRIWGAAARAASTLNGRTDESIAPQLCNTGRAHGDAAAWRLSGHGHEADAAEVALRPARGSGCNHRRGRRFR